VTLASSIVPAMGALANRMAKELKNLERDAGAGTCAWPKDDNIKELEAVVSGPEGTPYAQGQFTLTITIPNRWTFLCLWARSHVRRR
jgi:ubiquitin-protein ligase